MHPWNQPVLDSLKLRTERLPHALLIHGAQGVGKLALAEKIAQLLLCEATDASRKPCGSCEGCRWFTGGNHPDFRRLEPEALAQPPDAATEEEGEAPARRGKPSIEIKIDQVRELADFLNIGSHRGRLRVALVHPAEEMNASAANALLKALEEPPASAMFLLVSHRPSRLLPTIRSRCVALPVAIPRKEVALQWLSAQGMQNAERWLAYAGGAPLRALDYAGKAALIEHMLRSPAPVEDRDELELLVEALQKSALDRAFVALGGEPKYRTGASPAPRSRARDWLAYARRLGQDRPLCRHPLNPKLFSAELIAGMPDDATS
ncbi:MAG TPA: DNA polymerase III subunit delta' [Burkholderiales bacterium]|nr:DNA polymerase III subunit delta' [Burkholderiales bacterium]